jgi:hypothetical protein
VRHLVGGILLTAFLIAFILVTVGWGNKRYVEIMFDGYWTDESRIEAYHFSVQTVTTVGYGNWEPARLKQWKFEKDVEARQQKALELKRLSVTIMSLGATAFALVIASVSELLFSAFRPGSRADH